MSAFRTCALRVAVCVCAVLLTENAFGKIEAVKGKQYNLSSKHGPWMILVASFRDVPMERRKEGLTATQAANQLVYELRKMGLPAYVFRQGKQLGTLKEFSDNGEEKKFFARQDGVAVLAGNFASPDHEQAQKILKFLKTKYEPKFLQDERFGGIVSRTPGRPKALSRAQMTVNPLMSKDDVRRRSLDPLVKRLNADMEYSLLKNRGRYTLRIATFKGSSVVLANHQQQGKAKNFFDKMMGSSLDDAGNNAWSLTEALRSAKRLGYGQNFEAYVLHERYKSYVTVGSFDSPNDPRITTLANRFRGKSRIHQGKEVTTAEVLTIPKDLSGGKTPDKLWMFDATPKLIEVPGR